MMTDPSISRAVTHRSSCDADDAWEIGDAREIVRNGTLLKAFEFRGEITGSSNAMLFVTDDWDVLLAVEEYPSNWRDLPSDVLFNALLLAPRVDI